MIAEVHVASRAATLLNLGYRRSAGAIRTGWLPVSGNEQFLIDEALPRCVTLAGSCRG